jgi:hypothetical protein
VTLDGRESAWEQAVPMNGPQADLSFRLPGRPLRLDVDPAFDLFRRLDRNEIPPALSQVFGAERVTIVLPSSAPADLLTAYTALAESWKQGEPDRVEVRLDRDVESLPPDRAVWILGWENRHRGEIASAIGRFGASLSGTALRVGDADLPRENRAFALTGRHPGNPDLAIGWIAASSPAAVPGLGRKLPHYHKYSYLGFEGDEPANMLKGRWPVVDSPMAVLIAGEDGTAPKAGMAALAPRRALASLPPALSAGRMMDAVRTLSSAEMRGRGFGSPEMDRAADLIAAAFREAGLRPAGDTEGSYYQSWKARGNDPPREAVMRNVVGIIPGVKPEWAGQSVVVGAHYDHLGLGWPDVKAANAGKIHPGADDNASGVALLLELARALGKGWAPDRTVVFAAFAGEEAKRLGSAHYVTAQSRFPASKCIGMINLDTVGRLGEGKLLVLGAGSAREWTHIFNGAGYVTRVPLQVVEHDPEGSDQKSFLDAGVPAVQLFTGAHLDYHTPGDTAEKIDSAGLAKVAAVAREAIDYLAGRPEPLTSSLTAARAGAPPDAAPSGTAPPAPRKASLGTVPDFAYTGPGVRISGVAPGSPAEKAGLRPGDIIVNLAGSAVADLKSYSDALRKLEPGAKVPVTFQRDGKDQTLEVVLAAR